MKSQIVIMGVSAAGKSSVGLAVAERIGAGFVDADDLHPATNREKMAAGIPLTDHDRGPWLDAVADELAAVSEAAGRDGGLVLACSALRRSYRDRIRRRAGTVFFVHLDGEPALLAARAAARTGHFMPASLLASQLATLEPLGEDEPGIRLDVAQPLATLVEQAVAASAACGRIRRTDAEV